MPWLAAIRDAGDGASGSSNYPCARLLRLGDMYLEFVHSAGISCSLAGDRVTAVPNYLVLPDCCVSSLVL